MNIVDYGQFVLALLFVLGLIGAAALLARRFGLAQTVRPQGERRRLAVVESLAIDGKRRLLLVRRDDVEHLLILAPATETVIERSIRPFPVTDAVCEASHVA
ncbi:MAG: FliO/MopB family protein [Rhodospirillales bacterium]|nr:FliO/MopB family protein [Rhodospirillales bacterium]